MDFCVENLTPTEQNHIIVAGTVGSRFDHTMLNLNLLQKWTHNVAENVYILGLNDHSLQILVPNKTHFELKMPKKVVSNSGIGVIPLFGKVENLETEGLMWQIDRDLEINFGGFLSSSNEFAVENLDRELRFKNYSENDFLLTFDRSND